MASLYQRFTGKINTSRSFPAPPEASRLLGGQGPEEDGAGPKPLGAQAPAAGPRERGGGGGGGAPGERRPGPSGRPASPLPGRPGAGGGRGFIMEPFIGSRWPGARTDSGEARVLV